MSCVASPAREAHPIEDFDGGTLSRPKKSRSSSKASELQHTLRNTYVDYETEDKDSTAEKQQLCQSIGFHVKVLWACLSVMVTVGCSFSLLQPHWFTHSASRDSLGLYSYCVTEIGSHKDQPRVCDVYGGSFKLQHLPSNAWQVACLLYGIGCLLLTLSSLSSLATLLLSDRWSDRVAVYTGYSQTLAVVFLVISMLVFPAGLDCNFVRHHCGPDSKSFTAGDCHIGWAYVLAIMSTALAMFCPVLSQYTDFREGYDVTSSTEYL